MVTGQVIQSYCSFRRPALTIQSQHCDTLKGEKDSTIFQHTSIGYVNPLTFVRDNYETPSRISLHSKEERVYALMTVPRNVTPRPKRTSPATVR